MQRFKSIILPMQGHTKSELHRLYNTKYSVNPDFEEKEKVFKYCSLRFWFGGTSLRNSEKLLLFVEAPISLVGTVADMDGVATESYLLYILSPMIKDLSKEYANDAKSTREKAQFDAQTADEVMLRRSGIHYNSENHTVILTIHFNVPLVNALSVTQRRLFVP